MLQTIRIDGKSHKLHQSDVLGVGGEATVVKVGNTAVKIYHSPDSARAEKLQDFLRLGVSLPITVCAPQKLVHDSTGKKIVGFSMPLMSARNEAVQMLSSRKFRTSNPSYTSQFVADLFLDGYHTTALLHKAGIVVGDFNDLNLTFAPTQITFTDADSFQFGQHPCMVGTENFLDPALYNLDLAKKCYFKPEHDWYSWFVMFIRSLLLVHPYGGVHIKYPTIPERALARITFTDRNVKYPKAGYNPELLSKAIEHLFDRMFHKGERFIPPIDVFQEYRDSLTTCLHCKAMYPAERNKCPECSRVNTQQIQRQIKVAPKPGKRVVQRETMLTTTGEFVWRRIMHRDIYAIATEGNKFVLYIKKYGQSPRQLTICHVVGHPKFDLFDERYLVVHQGIGSEITILDIGDEKPVVVDKRSVDFYHGEPMFACNRDNLLRMNSGFLMRGWVDPKLSLPFQELNINGMIRNQTWLSASPYTTLVFGFQRIFRSLMFFTYRFDHQPKGELWMPKIDDLQNNESIIDIATYFAGSTILLLLKTEIKGKTYTRVYLVREDKILAKYRVDAVSSDTHRNIHGKAFAMLGDGSAIILHATDDGVVQEVVDPAGQSTSFVLKETEPFVSDSDLLDQFHEGILVTGDKTVDYLTIV